LQKKQIGGNSSDEEFTIIETDAKPLSKEDLEKKDLLAFIEMQELDE
jgi:hypothetical protein